MNRLVLRDDPRELCGSCETEISPVRAGFRPETRAIGNSTRNVGEVTFVAIGRSAGAL